MLWSKQDKLTSALGDFHLVEKDDEFFESESADQKDPYKWQPSHWIPNPVPGDYDIDSPPWLRPEQAAFSFVGTFIRQCLRLHIKSWTQIWDVDEELKPELTCSGVNLVDVESSKILSNQTVKIKAGKIASISASSVGDMQEEGWISVDCKELYLSPGLIDCKDVLLSAEVHLADSIQVIHMLRMGRGARLAFDHYLFAG
jgi:hypothetical protein